MLAIKPRKGHFDSENADCNLPSNETNNGPCLMPIMKNHQQFA